MIETLKETEKSLTTQIIEAGYQLRQLTEKEKDLIARLGTVQELIRKGEAMIQNAMNSEA